jgi:acyl-CoA thioester hydrolase
VKVEHSYELSRGGDVLVVGATTLACLDRDGRARALPDGILGMAPAAAPVTPAAARSGS